MSTVALPETPDYDVWPVEVAAQAVECSPRLLSVTWRDGRVSRYHSIWLRENAADDSTVNPDTRERILDLSRLADWPTLDAAWLDDAGAVCVRFVPEQRTLRFHPGWLQGCYLERDEVRSCLRMLRCSARRCGQVMSQEE